MDNYAEFLAQLDRLGQVLTMPVAVLLSVLIVCGVFLTWRLASWTFVRRHNPGRVREPEPPPPLDLTVLWRAFGRCWRAVRGA